MTNEATTFIWTDLEVNILSYKYIFFQLWSVRPCLNSARLETNVHYLWHTLCWPLWCIARRTCKPMWTREHNCNTGDRPIGILGTHHWRSSLNSRHPGCSREAQLCASYEGECEAAKWNYLKLFLIPEQKRFFFSPLSQARIRSVTPSVHLGISNPVKQAEWQDPLPKTLSTQMGFWSTKKQSVAKLATPEAKPVQCRDCPGDWILHMAHS